MSSPHHPGWTDAPAAPPAAPPPGPTVTADGWWMASDGLWYPPETHPDRGGSSAAGVSDDWQRPPWSLRHVLGGLGVWILSMIVVGIGLAVVLVSTDSSVSVDDTSSLGAGALMVGLIPNLVAFIGWPIWIARRNGAHDVKQALGLSFRPVDLGWALGGMVACLVGAAVLQAAVLEAFPVLEAETNVPFDTDSSFSGVEVALFFLGIAVLTPVAEEIFFRGFALPAFRHRLGLTLSILASSILFTAPHLLGTVSLAGVPLLAAIIGWWGIVLAVLRVKTAGRIAAPILTHGLLNGLTLFVALNPFGIDGLDEAAVLIGRF